MKVPMLLMLGLMNFQSCKWNEFLRLFFGTIAAVRDSILWSLLHVVDRESDEITEIQNIKTEYTSVLTRDDIMLIKLHSNMLQQQYMTYKGKCQHLGTSKERAWETGSSWYEFAVGNTAAFVLEAMIREDLLRSNVYDKVIQAPCSRLATADVISGINGSRYFVHILSLENGCNFENDSFKIWA